MDNFGFVPDSTTTQDNFGFQADPTPAPQPAQSLSDRLWNYLTTSPAPQPQVKSGFSMMADQATAGANQIEAAGKQIFSGKGNPIVNGVEGALKLGSGAGALFSSPLAPLFAPIGEGVNVIGNKLSDNQSLQKFATSNAGKNTIRATEDINNLAGTVGTIAGIEQARSAYPKVKSSIDTALEARKAAAVAQEAETANRLAGTIAQGDKADIPIVKKALTNFDVTNIHTYEDLYNALNDRIKTYSKTLDQTLETNPTTRPLNDLGFKTEVGGQTIIHNYVSDAIDQLRSFYQKVNDQESLAKINQIKAKAESTGLNASDLNNLARIHGQDLNGYNANGELASGLSKQAAENTRVGLKATARDMFGNPVYQATDSTISNLIRTRDLVGDVADKVNKLQQKIVERGFGEKTGRLVGQVADLFSGHALKGLFEYFTRRGEGAKVLNALDMEKNLQSNLSSLTEILNKNLPEVDVIKNLQDIIDSHSSGKPLPVKSQDTTSANLSKPTSDQMITKTQSNASMSDTKPLKSKNSK